MEKLEKLIEIGILSFTGIFFFFVVAFVIAIVTDGKKVWIRNICIMLLGTFFPIPVSWCDEIVGHVFPQYFRRSKKQVTTPPTPIINADFLYDLINRIREQFILSKWLCLMGIAAGGLLYWLLDESGRMCLTIAGVRWYYVYLGVMFWLIIHTVIQLGVYWTLYHVVQKHDKSQDLGGF